MNYKDIIITTLLIFIPLALLVLCYRRYVYNYCQNDMKCLKEKLIFNLNDINNKLKNSELNKVNNKSTFIEEEKKDENIEGFLGGLGNWFSGSSPTNLPVSPGIVANENLGLLEKKINDSMKKSDKFPPTELNGNSDDFKDSDNLDLLANINAKPVSKSLEKPFLINNNNPIPEAKFDKKNKSKETVLPKPPSIVEKKQNVKDLFESCQFFNDKCPDKYYPLGNFSIQGIGNSSILTCGNVQNTKPAHAIAQIKNNSVYEIHITDQGHGFNPSSPPKVSIEGGKGHGATAEAVIDDDGFLKLIKVINPGYNYSETPNILIDAPYMNSSCHLCCKDTA
jgi:hypothetical protein